MKPRQRQNIDSAPETTSSRNSLTRRCRPFLPGCAAESAGPRTSSAKNLPRMPVGDVMTSPSLGRNPCAARPPSLTHPVFHISYHAEHEMLRYINRLQAKGSFAHDEHDSAGVVHDEVECDERDAAGDLAGDWADASRVRPAEIRRRAIRSFSRRWRRTWRKLRGLTPFRLQPNAGSQGEYAGLLAIRAYHEHNAKSRVQ